MYIHRGTYRTNVLSHTKLIGQLSSSQQNVTDISHQWNHSKHKVGLNCCARVHLHLSVIKYITNNRLIKEQWRTNQLINQQTNNTDVKPFRNWCTMNEWLTDCEYLNLLYFTLWAVQTSNNKESCKTSIKEKEAEEVLCKWITWLSDSFFLGCALPLKIFMSVLCPID